MSLVRDALTFSKLLNKFSWLLDLHLNSVDRAIIHTTFTVWLFRLFWLKALFYSTIFFITIQDFHVISVFRHSFCYFMLLFLCILHLGYWWVEFFVYRRFWELWSRLWLPYVDCFFVWSIVSSFKLRLLLLYQHFRFCILYLTKIRRFNRGRRSVRHIFNPLIIWFLIITSKTRLLERLLRPSMITIFSLILILKSRLISIGIRINIIISIIAQVCQSHHIMFFLNFLINLIINFILREIF